MEQLLSQAFERFEGREERLQQLSSHLVDSAVALP